MSENMMAYPELRHPYEATPIHGEDEATLLYQGRRLSLQARLKSDALLVRSRDLPDINGYEVKPEGACHGELCVPLAPSLTSEIDGEQWLNLTGFADLVGQPYVADVEARVWSFAEMPSRREAMMTGAQAPDLTLTDRQGNVVRLADLKGKKALIVTWSSW